MNVIQVGIDLGTKNTGIVIFNNGRSAGHLVRVDERETTWSMNKRTAARHQRRGYKRRRLAKRLLRVLLRDGYGFKLHEKITTNQTVEQFFFGCLNRRGFTFLNEVDDELNYVGRRKLTEEDQQTLEKSSNLIKNLKNQYDNLEQLISRISNLGEEELRQVQTEIEKSIEAKWVSKKADVIYYLKVAIENSIAATTRGAKSRRRYFLEIHQEIENKFATLPTEDRRRIGGCDLDVNQISNLVGNISNLQLRTLRKYFNNENYRDNRDIWDGARFAKIWKKSIVSWHPNGDENVRELRAKLLKLLTDLSTTKVLTILLNTPANETTPPFEDQNNRRPIVARTLILSHEAILRSEWGKYFESWCDKLQLNNKEWMSTLPAVETFNFEMTYKKNASEIEERKKNQIRALFLQRILDRSKVHDPYELRRFRRLPKESWREQKGFAELKTHLLGAGELAESFLVFAVRYYHQLDLIKNGDFDLADLFVHVHGRPRMNKNGESLLLAARFGLHHALSEDQLNKIRDGFKENLGNKATVKSVSALLAKLEKENGSKFLSRLDWILRLPAAEEKDGRAKYFDNFLAGIRDKELRELFCAKGRFEQLSQLVGVYSEKIRESINPDPAYLDSILDMVHIYNILFTDRTGFAKALPWVAVENLWRNKRVASITENETGARCIALQEMTTRPIDGVVTRIFQHVTSVIAREIVKSAGDNWSGNLDIAIEENAFQAQRDLLDLKKKFGITTSSKSYDRLDKQNENSISNESDKRSRIVNANYNLCPYTGRNIDTNQIELDHIIPRSYSLKSFQTIFDNEMNLIATTREGNQIKGNEIYSFEDLSPLYKQRVFPGKTDAEIIDWLETSWASETYLALQRATFRDLSEENRIIARHVLFLDETSLARKEAMLFLNSRAQVTVSGTQRFFIETLKKKLRALAEKQSFGKIKIGAISHCRVKSSIVSSERDRIVQKRPELAKEEIQSAYSHVVDAALTLSAGLLKNGEVLDPETILPASLRIHWPKEKGPYHGRNWGIFEWFSGNSNRFHSLPIWIYHDGLRVGFNIGNQVQIKSELEVKFWENVSPYLETDMAVDLSLSLDKLKALAKEKKPYYCSINLKKYSELFTRIQSESDIKHRKALTKVENILSSCTYFTCKKELTSMNEAVLDGEFVLKNATIKTNGLKSFLVEPKSIRLPIAEKLDSIIQFNLTRIREMDLDETLSKAEKQKKLHKETLQRVVEEFALRQGGDSRQKKRTLGSIPLLKHPQGAAALIRRRSILGKDVFQVQIGGQWPVDRNSNPVLPHPVRISRNVIFLKEDLELENKAVEDPWWKPPVAEESRAAGVVGRKEMRQQSHLRQCLELEAEIALALIGKPDWRLVLPQEKNFDKNGWKNEWPTKPRNALDVIYLSDDRIEFGYTT